jgi:hypothetical protein
MKKIQATPRPESSRHPNPGTDTIRRMDERAATPSFRVLGRSAPMQKGTYTRAGLGIDRPLKSSTRGS